MRLLILTQRVDKDDDILGFFHRWIEEFSHQVEQINVVCLWEGEHNLPRNVSVHSLGKESGTSKFSQLASFYRYIWKLRKGYDSVFVHMNPEYVVFGGILWRLWGKRIALWYTHRAVHWKLHIAEKFSHVIFSASGYSFQLPSDKLTIIGHGIDTGMFKCVDIPAHKGLKILSVGRITEIKDGITLVKALKHMNDEHDVMAEVTFVGDSVTEKDRTYQSKLNEYILKENLDGQVTFVGSVPNANVLEYYCSHDIVANLTPDGGVDKTVIEAMSSGRIPIVSNNAFKEYFGPYAKDLIFKHGNHEDLSYKINKLVARDDQNKIIEFLIQQAKEKFSVEKVIEKIIRHLALV